MKNAFLFLCFVCSLAFAFIIQAYREQIALTHSAMNLFLASAPSFLCAFSMLFLIKLLYQRDKTQPNAKYWSYVCLGFILHEISQKLGIGEADFYDVFAIMLAYLSGLLLLTEPESRPTTQ